MTDCLSCSAISSAFPPVSFSLSSSTCHLEPIFKTHPTKIRISYKIYAYKTPLELVRYNTLMGKSGADFLLHPPINSCRIIL